MEYLYDCFISWTGKDFNLKEQIVSFLESNSLRVYDSSKECQGRFRDNFCDALMMSKVYILILTDNVFNNPSLNSETSYFSEVRRELDLALDLDARGMINIVTLQFSKTFDFLNLPKTEVEKYFYASLSSFSKIKVDIDNLDVYLNVMLKQVNTFIEKRYTVVLPSNAIRMPIAKTNIMPSSNFVGREDEIRLIDDAFKNGRMVFLSGIGGIGKSELAMKYASIKDNDVFEQQIKFTQKEDNNLKNLVMKIKFTEEVEEESRKMSRDDEFIFKLNKLKSIPSSTILLIDNFNNATEEDISEILSHLNCRFLVTTRLKNIENNEVTVINIESMNFDICKMMFHIDVNDEEMFTLKMIYDLVKGHTMTLSIINKLITSQGLTLNEVYKKLQYPLQMEERVFFSHNEYKNNESLYNHLINLFDLSLLDGEMDGLNKDKINLILSSLSLVYDDGIKESYLKEALNLNTSNEIIFAADRGWIERKLIDGEYFVLMHHIISSLIVCLLKPNSSTNVGITEKIASLCINQNDDYKTLRNKKEMLFFAISKLRDCNDYSFSLCDKYLDILILLYDEKQIDLFIEMFINILNTYELSIILKKEMFFSFNMCKDSLTLKKKTLRYSSILKDSYPLLTSWMLVNASTILFNNYNSEDGRELLDMSLLISLKQDNLFFIVSIYVSLVINGYSKNDRKRFDRLVNKRFKKASKISANYIFSNYIFKTFQIAYDKVSTLEDITSLDGLSLIKNIKLTYLHYKTMFLMKKVKDDDPYYCLKNYISLFNNDSEITIEKLFENIETIFDRIGLDFNYDGLIKVILSLENNNFVSKKKEFLEAKENSIIKASLLYPENSINYFSEIEKLIENYCDMEEYDKAFKETKKLISLYEKYLPKNHLKKVDVYEKAAILCEKNKIGKSDATNYYFKALNVLKANGYEMSEKYLTLYTSFIACVIKYKMINAYSQKILDDKMENEESFVKLNILYSTLHMNYCLQIAVFYKLANEKMKYYLMINDLYEKIDKYKVDKYSFYSLINEYVVSLSEANIFHKEDYEKAIRCLLDNIDYYNETPVYLKYIYSKIGHIYYLTDNFDLSRSYYEKALSTIYQNSLLSDMNILSWYFFASYKLGQVLNLFDTNYDLYFEVLNNLFYAKNIVETDYIIRYEKGLDYYSYLGYYQDIIEHNVSRLNTSSYNNDNDTNNLSPNELKEKADKLYFVKEERKDYKKALSYYKAYISSIISFDDLNNCLIDEREKRDNVVECLKNICKILVYSKGGRYLFSDKLKYLEKLSFFDKSLAYYYFGIIYTYDHDNMDFKKAYEYFEKASKLGNKKALFNLKLFENKDGNIIKKELV